MKGAYLRGSHSLYISFCFDGSEKGPTRGAEGFISCFHFICFFEYLIYLYCIVWSTRYRAILKFGFLTISLLFYFYFGFLILSQLGIIRTNFSFFSFSKP